MKYLPWSLCSSNQVHFALTNAPLQIKINLLTWTLIYQYLLGNIWMQYMLFNTLPTYIWTYTCRKTIVNCICWYCTHKPQNAHLKICTHTNTHLHAKMCHHVCIWPSTNISSTYITLTVHKQYHPHSIWKKA